MELTERDVEILHKFTEQLTPEDLDNKTTEQLIIDFAEQCKREHDTAIDFETCKCDLPVLVKPHLGDGGMDWCKTCNLTVTTFGKYEWLKPGCTAWVSSIVAMTVQVTVNSVDYQNRTANVSTRYETINISIDKLYEFEAQCPSR